jgi:hypothetical protein
MTREQETSFQGCGGRIHENVVNRLDPVLAFDTRLPIRPARVSSHAPGYVVLLRLAAARHDIACLAQSVKASLVPLRTEYGSGLT